MTKATDHLDATDRSLHMPVVAEADDGFGEWLADGVVSLHLRENTVDVVIHPHQSTEPDPSRLAWGATRESPLPAARSGARPRN